MTESLKTIIVTMEVCYAIPMHDEKRSKINGWTPEQVVHSWFEHHDINRYHATRDSHRLGNGTKIIKTEIVECGEDIEKC